MVWVGLVVGVAAICSNRTTYEKLCGIKKRNCFTMFWPCMKVYHPLVMSFFTLKTKRRHISLLYHALSLLIYIFSIVLASLIQVLYVEDMDYNQDKAFGFGGVYLVVYMLLRPFFNKAKYVMYFHEKEIKMPSQPNEGLQTEH